jgi:hypothetical protein
MAFFAPALAGLAALIGGTALMDKSNKRKSMKDVEYTKNRVPVDFGPRPQLGGVSDLISKYDGWTNDNVNRLMDAAPKNKERAQKTEEDILKTVPPSKPDTIGNDEDGAIMSRSPIGMKDEGRSDELQAVFDAAWGYEDDLRKAPPVKSQGEGGEDPDEDTETTTLNKYNTAPFSIQNASNESMNDEIIAKYLKGSSNSDFSPEMLPFGIGPLVKWYMKYQPSLLKDYLRRNVAVQTRK